MQFGYPNRVELHQVFERDPALLFRMKPGYDFKLGFGPLNQQGFRGKDFSNEKPAGVFRIACLGDSVTFGTAAAAYPELLEQILNGPGGKIFQVYNFGVPGYSSEQGKNLLRKVMRDYHPDLVIILYGWNDHWRARGFSDSEQKIKSEIWLTRIRDPVSKLRTYQLLNKFAANLPGLAPRSGQEKFRVPAGNYRKNLKEMVERANAEGAKVILLTAPAGFGLGPLPDYFEYLGFLKQGDSLEQIHNRYNLMVREVTQETGAPLLDLDLILRARNVKTYFDHPDQDIIHPNAAGMLLIARSLADSIGAAGRHPDEKEESQ